METVQLVLSQFKNFLTQWIHNWIRSRLPKIRNERCELLTICHINRSGPVFLRHSVESKHWNTPFTTYTYLATEQPVSTEIRCNPLSRQWVTARRWENNFYNVGFWIQRLRAGISFSQAILCVAGFATLRVATPWAIKRTTFIFTMTLANIDHVY